MFTQFLKSNLTCLGTNIFQASKLTSAPISQTGIRFVRFDSPKFPTRFLRKPTFTAGQTSPQALAQEYSEVAEEDMEKTKEVWDLVNNQIESHSYGRLFAVVMIGWHQHKVSTGDLLMVNHDIGAKPGQIIKLDKVLLVGSRDFTFMGRPLLPRDLLSVSATVIEKGLSQTKISQKFRKRQNYRIQFFNREYQTTLRINQIEILKNVDKSLDRSGFEPPRNNDPMLQT